MVAHAGAPSKVAQLDVVVLVEEQILRLEISVDVILRMDESQALCGLREELGYL